MRMWQAERLPYKDASNSWQGGRLPYKGKRGDKSCFSDRARLVTVRGFDQRIRKPKLRRKSGSAIPTSIKEETPPHIRTAQPASPPRGEEMTFPRT